MTERFLEKILAQKVREVAALPKEVLKVGRTPQSFYQRVRQDKRHLHVIAELKRASPSLGVINEEVNLLTQARTYSSAGASMISVLTDQSFFKGSLADLAQVAEQVDLPILNKDFIIDERQIIRAYNAGASLILLIVAALSVQRLRELYDFAMSLGLEVLVETHNLAELQVAHELDAKIIGVNNRDLRTFETNLQTSLDLAQHFGTKAIYISESAIDGAEDARQLVPFFDGILVGRALMQADRVADKLEELRIDKG